jgi:uncharacterized repeat protein (TIGR01451 family)
LGSGVTAIAAGEYHTCALTSGGGVKCWGFNGYGELGDGTTTQRTTPVDVSGLGSGVSAISAGHGYTCALTSGGGVKCWGDNQYGQLGDGTTTQRTTPVDVSGLGSGVAAISAGAFHTCALTSGGGVKCWGDNLDGDLGDGTTTQRTTPVDVSGLGSGVASISAGYYHTCALTSGGGVKCWGDPADGQLGDGTTTVRTTPVAVSGLGSGVAAISAGAFHTCALTTGGGVKCWGYNGNGQLGDGTSSGPQTCAGSPCSTTPVDVSGLGSGVTAIAAGGYHTCALTSGGGVKCWGANYAGQLGDGTTTQRTTPVDVVALNSATLTVNKNFSDSSSASVTVSVTCTNGGTPAPPSGTVSHAAPRTYTITGFTAGATCTATETVPTGYTESDNCASVAIANGGAPSCTITNTLNSATFTVNKVYSPTGPATSVPVSVNCSSGTPTPGSGSASPSTPFTTTVTGFNTSGTTCTATETVPAGYTETDNCASVSITAGGTPSCTITNTLNSAILTVNKVYSPTGPATSVPVSVSCSSGTPSPGSGPASPSTPFTTTVTGFDTSGTTCTATETVPAGYAETDNCASVSITVGGTPNCTIINGVQADLSVTKSAAPNPAKMANPLTYTVTVNNGGPSGATGVTLTDTLPGSVTFGSATPSQGSCNQALGVVTCGLGSIANGGNATVSIVVTPTTGNPLTNTAVVSGNEADPNGANNTVTITTPALWQCTKSDSTVVYRAWLSPAGDSDCDGFSDTIENFVGTDPLVACGGTALPDGSSSTWPPDFNNDGRVNLSDVLKYSPVFNTMAPGPPYNKRFDLNADGKINLSDILKLSPFFNQSCANP